MRNSWSLVKAVKFEYSARIHLTYTHQFETVLKSKAPKKREKRPRYREAKEKKKKKEEEDKKTSQQHCQL